MSDVTAASRKGATSTLDVALGERSYRIAIGPGLLGNAAQHIAPLLRRKRCYVVTDTNVAQHHLRTLAAALNQGGIEVTHVIVLPPGEETKTFSTAGRVVEELLGNGLERSDLVVALGGGVVGDITGFAAAIALRGVGFVQIPTTLLAQVDSSVGGKTGIDTAFGKNTIGAFHQPRLVLIDTLVLNTLPEREVKAGYAEIVKYGAIRDEPFFTWLEANGGALLRGDDAARSYAIERSCATKAVIVAADEREEGERALLNLGHTFGHALESETGFSAALVHGEAVAIGMAMAARFSAARGFCPASDADRLIRHLKATGLPFSPADRGLAQLDPTRILSHMKRDKKVKDGRITLILLKRLGEAFVTRDVAEGDLLHFLKQQLH